MRQTSSTKTALHRMAEVMGWGVESAGRVWRVTNQDTFKGLAYNHTALLCVMIRVAMSPLRIGGEGLSGKEVRELISFEPAYDAHGYLKRAYPSTDEVTLFKLGRSES